MPSALDQRLKGSRLGHFWQELFANSIHFPLINIFLEVLLNDPYDYLLEPDLYAILIGALAQAYFISRWRYAGYSRYWFGNLIGPAVYTGIEFALEGGAFFDSPNHLAYWAFGFVIGGLQQWRVAASATISRILLLLENVVRTGILLVMYVILEFIKDDYASFAEYISDPTHRFVTLSIPFIGIILGFAAINALRYQEALHQTAQQLRKYSEWLLGRELLSQAVADPASLQVARRERAILFMDIRGFTGWSEVREPEDVLTLINAFYREAEPVWLEHGAIKVKLTADEIMLVFADADSAVTAALALRKTSASVLLAQGLMAGTGVHFGPVIEGLIGTPDSQHYDLLGDSVNTAKRLCDAAAGGEILISGETNRQCHALKPQGDWRDIQMKGKSRAIPVLALNQGALWD